MSETYLNEMSQKEKNRMIAENTVQTTIHFQKRIDKIFSLVQGNFFDTTNNLYHVVSYYYRIEFQQRGAPHCHALLWLKDKDGKEAPNFWFNQDDLEGEDKTKAEEQRMREIESFTDALISVSPNEMSCIIHNSVAQECCSQCKHLQEKVKKYQTHAHTHTCAKKKENNDNTK